METALKLRFFTTLSLYFYTNYYDTHEFNLSVKFVS